MMDSHVCKQHREEISREVEQNRLTKALRESRKRCARANDRASSLAWELRRVAGQLLKLVRSLRRTG